MADFILQVAGLFVLAKVGHAGGLYQVVPVGVFQPRARWYGFWVSCCRSQAYSCWPTVSR